MNSNFTVAAEKWPVWDPPFWPQKSLRKESLCGSLWVCWSAFPGNEAHHFFGPVGTKKFTLRKLMRFSVQWSPNPPEFAQPRLSRAQTNGHLPSERVQIWGCVCSYMAGIMQVWGCKFWVCLICVISTLQNFALLERGCARFGWVWSSRFFLSSEFAYVGWFWPREVIFKK